VRQIVLALLPIISLFLQTTIFGTYSIKGTVPDLILVFVVFYALFNGSSKGAMYGLMCGLLEDLYMGRFIGLNALSKALVALTVSKLQGKVFRENILVGVFAVMFATLLNSLIMGLIALASFQIFNLNMSILNSILYQTCYNTILAIPFYIWYYHSNRTGLLHLSGD
jgi:rod shape-determining protein MreD